MNKTEIGELLLAVSAIDNRKITQQMVDGWTEILRHVPLDIALEAHRMARKNEAVGYLEPKHIISFAKEAAYALDRAKPKVEEKPAARFPMPNCRAHGVGILSCDPCADKIYRFTKEHGFDRAHDWAKAEIYG